MKVQRTQDMPDPKPTCRQSLRAAIIRTSRRRNWVQVGLCTFGLAGLGTNIAATGLGVGKTMALAAGGVLAFAKLVFLFYWLAAQILLWLLAVGVLGRLLSGRALTMREAADGLLSRT